MASDTTTRPAPPEEIQAGPVRPPGRWIAAAVIALLVAMFVHMLVTNPVFQWQFMVDNMFSPPVLRGARTTLVMTVLAMLLGVLLGIIVAIMRLSPEAFERWAEDVLEVASGFPGNLGASLLH